MCTKNIRRPLTTHLDQKTQFFKWVKRLIKKTANEARGSIFNITDPLGKMNLNHNETLNTHEPAQT